MLTDLQIFDYIIITVFFTLIYIGWKNGLIVTLMAFFAWVGSAIIVFDSYETLFKILEGYIHSKFISGFLASVGFYIILVVAFSLLGERLSKYTQKFGGSTTDKVTGAIFGGFCGFLIDCAIFWCCYMTLFTLNDQKFPEWFGKAKTYKALKISSDFVMGVAFSDEDRAKFLNLIKKKSNKLEEEVKENINSKKKEYKLSSTRQDRIIEEDEEIVKF